MEALASGTLDASFCWEVTISKESKLSPDMFLYIYHISSTLKLFSPSFLLDIVVRLQNCLFEPQLQCQTDSIFS